MATRKLADQARNSHSQTYSGGTVRDTQRTYSLGEANAVLPEVRRLVEQIVTISGAAAGSPAVSAAARSKWV